MRLKAIAAVAVSAGAVILADDVTAEVFQLQPIVVQTNTHPSQEVRQKVEGTMDESRSSSTASGAALQNINPVNKRDALRYNSIGTIGGPGNGSRFGGPTSIRTFGDFGAAQSIDGMPAFKTIGSDGAGYQGTAIPSIAIDRISVEKGGRGVGYGDGTDGGVFVTRIKSGRGYKDHAAISIDGNTAPEALIQGEYADSTAKWDLYSAVNGLYGSYT